MDIGLPATFCFDLDRALLFSESSVEIILVGPFVMLYFGGVSRLLLRGDVLAVHSDWL